MSRVVKLDGRIVDVQHKPSCPPHVYAYKPVKGSARLDGRPDVVRCSNCGKPRGVGCG